jgi:hypothetical protein
VNSIIIKTKNMENLQSNMLELASNLAHDRTFYESGDILYNEDEMYQEGGENYTEEIQERFNDWYGFYLSEIEKVFNPSETEAHPNY